MAPKATPVSLLTAQAEPEEATGGSQEPEDESPTSVRPHRVGVVPAGQWETQTPWPPGDLLIMEDLVKGREADLYIRLSGPSSAGDQ